MKTYYVYMVRCSDDSLYTGVTNNADRRVAEHNIGYDEEAYTWSRRPVVLVWASPFNDIVAAINFEKQLKGWSRKKKLALIRDDWSAIHELARDAKRHGR